MNYIDISLYIIGGKIRHEQQAVSGAVSMFELDNTRRNEYAATRTI